MGPPGRAGGLLGLTAGQLSGGHAFFVVTTTSPSRCCSHSCVTQWSPGSDQDSPGCRESRRQVSGPPPGPLQLGRALCLSISPQPTGFQSSRGSAQRPPSSDSSPGSPVHQDATHPAPPPSLCALPSVQGWGWPPAQNTPQGFAATTHVEEVGRAVAGVYDAGHLHALTTALPGPSLVLEALREAGRGLSPSGRCGGGCGGQVQGHSPRGRRCCRSGSHS